MSTLTGRIFTNNHFINGTIEFDNTISEISESLIATDCASAYIIPGLIDIHTHGALGYDALDADYTALKQMSGYYAHNGVTSFCPTLATASIDSLCKASKAIADYASEQATVNNHESRILGINLEGPFLSPRKAGAHNPSLLSLPSVEKFERISAHADGMIKLITVAPELEGAMDFIDRMKRLYPTITVSIGHTAADYDTTASAIEHGASHMTHLYNCMEQIHSREPGPILAALDSEFMPYAELITDGYHISPAVVRMTSKLWGNRLILISDSLSCAGMPDGDYSLSNLAVTLQDGVAHLKGSDTIAGSSISLMEGLRRAYRYGMKLEAAIQSATINPAMAIGCNDLLGSLEAGKRADMVVLDSDLNILDVYIDGIRIQ